MARLGNRLSGFSRGGEPRRFRPLDLRKSLFRSRTECGACFQIGDVSDVSTVFVTVEDMDVIVTHGSSLSRRS